MGEMTSPTEQNLLPPDGKRIDHRQLYDIIVKGFDDGGLRQLCFDLDFLYDELAGDRHSERVLDLVDIFKRRSRLSVLLNAVRRYRPEYNYELLFIEITDADSAETPGPHRQASPADKSNTLILSKSIVALMRLMRSEDVNNAVVIFQTGFEATSSQINRLNEYKLLHDMFQDLERHYSVINTQQVRLPGDIYAWDTIIDSEPELRNQITDLIETATQASFADDDERWLRQLLQAQDAIRKGVEDEDDVALKRGMRQVYAILSRQPTRLNTSLVNTANGLQFSTIETALVTIYERVSTADASTADELVQELGAGKSALNGLEDRVHNLVREHKAWQYIDDELRRVEGMGLEELSLIWFDLESATLEAIGDSEEEWAVKLRDLVAALTTDIDEDNTTRIRRNYRRFRSNLIRRFRRVDASLLTLCQELQRVGESIDLLLRNYR